MSNKYIILLYVLCIFVIVGFVISSVCIIKLYKHIEDNNDNVNKVHSHHINKLYSNCIKLQEECNRLNKLIRQHGIKDCEV